MPCNNHPAEHQAEQPLVSHESEQPAAEHETTQAAPKPKSPHQPGPQHGKISEDQNKALNIHNRARSDATKSSGHPRGNLVWDGELAANAATYAHKLASANKGLQHSSGDARPNQGENLYWSKPNGSMADASQGWVDEKKNYHGQKIGEGNFGSYGHYTQSAFTGK
ncbi:MAG: hypothetical protein LQ343_001593 [Gyalolechia ehrenbergii]|nr:MAG: hypothetical protein LQ343_001593 [Gyalolechia ehrenbergii]